MVCTGLVKEEEAEAVLLSIYNDAGALVICLFKIFKKKIVRVRFCTYCLSLFDSLTEKIKLGFNFKYPQQENIIAEMAKLYPKRSPTLQFG